MHDIVSQIDKGFEFSVEKIDEDLLRTYKYYVRLNFAKTKAYVCRFTWDGKKQTTHLLHRDIAKRMFSQVPKNILIDHIDGNPLNNQRANLRLATSSQNAMNMAKKGSKGICRTRSGLKWRAYIVRDNKQWHLGIYLTQQEAQEAYNEAAKILFGEFACPV